MSLLSALPLRARRVTRQTAGAAMAWAPAIGLLLGAIAAAVLTGADHLLGGAPLLAATLAVVTMALLTRGLHLDGLADLADGLGSGKPAAGALEIMRRSDIGPFGVVALVLNLLIQVAALAQAQARGHGPAALMAAAFAGRLGITWACRRGVRAARQLGLGALVAGTVPAAVPAAITVGVTGMTCLAAVLLPVRSGGWLLPASIAAGLAASLAVATHAAARACVCLTVMAA